MPRHLEIGFQPKQLNDLLSDIDNIGQFSGKVFESRGQVAFLAALLVVAEKHQHLACRARSLTQFFHQLADLLFLAVIARDLHQLCRSFCIHASIPPNQS